MRQVTRRFRRFPNPVLPILVVAVATIPEGRALDQKIDARATYLRTNQDPVPDALAIPLSSAGVSGGDCVHLERLGDFNNGPNGDTRLSMIAVFSRTATLLASSELHRVVDALDAGVDYVTSPTYYGALPTDIPEDFGASAPGGVDLLAPPGAAYLFAASNDQYYSDNSDPDNDYYIRILPISPFEVSSASSSMPLVFLDRLTLQWEDLSLTCADTFNVYRGDVRDLPSRQYGTCWRSGLTTNTAVDPDRPAEGTGWFYLVTARNAIGEGPLGKDSAGQARVAASPCP